MACGASAGKAGLAEIGFRECGPLGAFPGIPPLLLRGAVAVVDAVLHSGDLTLLRQLGKVGRFNPAVAT